jgi:permease for cytosine/purines
VWPSSVLASYLWTAYITVPLFLILSAVAIGNHDWNLYSASLGLVNTIHQMTGRRVSRSVVTLAVGALGTALSIAGILDHFIGFLTLLGVVFPPIAGILSVASLSIYLSLARSPVTIGAIEYVMRAFSEVVNVDPDAGHAACVRRCSRGLVP